MQDLSVLYSEIQDLPDSLAQVALIKEGIRLADQLNDDKYSLIFRDLLIDNAAYSGIYSDMRDALSAFSWKIAYFDRNGRPVRGDLLDLYQWLCRWIVVYPEVSKAKLTEILDDFKRRYSAAGFNLRAYYEALMVASSIMGDIETAAFAHKKYNESGHMDSIINCEGCVACRNIKYYRAILDHKATMKAMEIFKRYGAWCNMNPKTAWNEAVASAVEAGDFEGKIEGYQQAGYKAISRDAYFLADIGWHIQFYAAKDSVKGFNLYKKHLAWTLTPNRFPLSQLYFNLGAAVILKLVGLKRKNFKAHFSRQLPFYKEDGVYNFNEVEAHHIELARGLATRFDCRNGNSFYTEQVERLYGREY